MPTSIDPVKLIYLVAYDGQPPRVGVEYTSPLNPNSSAQDTVEITEPELLADIETLHAKIASVKRLERAPAPGSNA